ncbi:hypothetical protein O9993_15570 [Vibrio lentus]|nr:hypothetical protein [Vibrio lentus]
MEATQLETPGQVSVIDEQIIDEQRASTLGEVLKNETHLLVRVLGQFNRVSVSRFVVLI